MAASTESTTMEFNSIEAQASYGIGLQFAQQLRDSGLQGLVPEALICGLRDVLADKEPALSMTLIHDALREMQQRADQQRQRQQQQRIEQDKQFLQQNLQREGVQCTESGLQFRVINQGTGAIPARQDRVQVHYTGKLTDGRVFDSSVSRGQPAEFPVNGVISGWTEALCMMPVGSRWELTLPHHLAYGERGAGKDIPPFSTLIFEVELLDIVC